MSVAANGRRRSVIWVCGRPELFDDARLARTKSAVCETGTQFKALGGALAAARIVKTRASVQ